MARRICATRLEESLRRLQTDCIDVLQLHTWTRAWNRNPKPLETLRQFQKEGKIRAIGISTPEHDQNALVDLMRAGWLDSIQVIYNIFDQEAQAELLPVAQEHGVGVIVRVVLDEGSLAGKWTAETKFAEGDFRNRYFAGDRLPWAVRRVEQVRETIGDLEPNMVDCRDQVRAETRRSLQRPRRHPQRRAGRDELRRQRSACHDGRVGDRPAQAQLAPGILVRRDIEHHTTKTPRHQKARRNRLSWCSL